MRLQRTLLIPFFLPRYHLLTIWEAKEEDHLFYLAYGIGNTLFCQHLMKFYLHQTIHKFCSVTNSKYYIEINFGVTNSE